MSSFLKSSYLFMNLLFFNEVFQKNVDIIEPCQNILLQYFLKIIF